MLLSLVDALRCPAEHELASLVLSAERWADGRVSSGILGCPVCHARYAIREGVADFAGGYERDERAELRREITTPDALRLAAQLALSEDGGLVLLTAGYAMLAPALDEMVNATYLVVDPGPAMAGSSRVVGIRLLEKIPLVDGALHAAAVDDSRADPFFLGEVARTVRDGGRIVAPADSLPPGNVRLLARDQGEWVGEVERPGSLVTPQRAIRR